MVKFKYNGQWIQVDGNYRSQVIENTKAQFPTTGDDKTVYIATDENKIYRWDVATSTYIALGGDEYTFSTGLTNTNNTITVDETYVATKEDLEDYRTSADQDEIDNGKIDTTAIETTLSASSTNDKVASAKAAWDLYQTATRQTFQKVDTTVYPTLEEFLASTGQEGIVYLYPTDAQENNYYKYIWENSAWVSLGTTAIDLSNYVDLTSAQTISGVKTFSGDVNLSSRIVLTDFFPIKIGNYDRYVYSTTAIYPFLNNYYNLGTSTYKWKDLYLSGKIYGATQNANTDDIINGTFNVINASEIINNTLTQAQYDLITNGKSTRIVGTYSGRTNAILFPCTLYSGKYYGQITGYDSYGGTSTTVYVVDEATKVITIRTNQIRFTTFGDFQINGKQFPSYSRGLFSYDGTNLKWVDNGIVADTTSTTFSGALASAKTYTFATALTNINISGLEVQNGDNNPKWDLLFVKGSSLASITFPSGATMTAGMGSVAISDLENNVLYELYIEKNLAANDFTYWIIRRK